MTLRNHQILLLCYCWFVAIVVATQGNDLRNLLYDKAAPQQVIKNGEVDQEENTLRLLQDVTATLQDEWFDVSTGRWLSSIDWTGAVLNTQLVGAVSTLSKARYEKNVSLEIDELINIYFAQSIAYFFGEHAGDIKNQAYDDMSWVVLSWLDTTRFIGHHARRYLGSKSIWHGHQFRSGFMKRAEEFYKITLDGWSTDLCGGGILWRPLGDGRPYKNAITNQLFIDSSVGLYLHAIKYDISSEQSNSKLLRTAIDGYAWLKRSNMTNSQGLYVDGYHIRNWHKNGTGGHSCNDRNEMIYTYNQGVLLSGLSGLWQATNNITYLEDAHQLVSNTIAATGWLLSESTYSDEWSGLGRGGVIEDFCDASGNCDQNGHAFKSIYFHHLAQFCQPAASNKIKHSQRHIEACRSYTPWVAHNAQAALSTRDKHGKIGNWWNAGRYKEADSVALPLGAVDYRNNPSSSRITAHKNNFDILVGEGQLLGSKQTRDHNDLGAADRNDRGLGRTVESHGAGVAVLSCLWQLLQL